MIGRWFLVALVAFSLSAGCTKQIRPEEAVIKKDASLEELLSLYRLRGETASFKGLMTLTAEFPQQGRHTFQATLSSQKGQIQVRIFNLFGGTLFDLRMKGPNVSWTLPSEGQTFEGSRADFEDKAPAAIPFGSIELLDWVARGAIPKITPPDLPALEKGEDFFILYLFNVNRGKATLKEKLWIERSAFWVKKVEMFDSAGTRRAVVTLDNYRNVGGRDFPFTIEGQGEEKGKAVALNFKEISLIAAGPPSGGSP